MSEFEPPQSRKPDASKFRPGKFTYHQEIEVEIAGARAGKEGEGVALGEGFAVRAGFGGTGLEHQDARMVFADTEFRDGADHAVGHLAVRLASGDFESAGQHRAGQRNDDEVTLVEITRATDDAAGLGLADIHLAPVNGLAVALRLRLERHNLTDDNGTGDLEAVGVLFFEADLN